MEAGGAYLMVVKANQKSLYEDIEKNIVAAIRKTGWKPNGALELLGLMT